MAPQQGSGKRKEDFVKWKDNHGTREPGQSHGGGASTSVARRTISTCRPQSTVTDHIQEQEWSDSEEPPQNEVLTHIVRDEEPEVGADMQHHPQIPKPGSSSRFVLHRPSAQSPSVAPRLTAGNSPQNRTRQASSSPLGRPLGRLPEQPHYFVEDDASELPDNVGGGTYKSPPEG